MVLIRSDLGPAPARVLHQVRLGAPITRADVVRGTGLSAADVDDTTGALIEAGLVRECGDGAHRDSASPLEIRGDGHAVLGVHVGRLVTTVGLVDLTGHVVAQSRTATLDDSDSLVSEIAGHATRLSSNWPERKIVAAGLAAPWDDLAHEQDALAALVEGRLGLAVHATNHVAAVAAAEYLRRRRADEGCTVYVYARDTAGFVLADDRPDRTEISRVTSLTHFPAGGHRRCTCGRTGCFATMATDDAVAQLAVECDIVDSPEIEVVLAAALGGNDRADRLLRDRASVLGRTVALIGDMVGPDGIVLVGQAFTGYRPAMPVVIDAFERATARAPIQLSFTRMGGGVQAAAAATVALADLYADPLREARLRVAVPEVPVSGLSRAR